MSLSVGAEEVRLRANDAQWTSLEHRRKPISPNSRVLLTGGNVGEGRKSQASRQERGDVASAGGWKLLGGRGRTRGAVSLQREKL